MAGRRARGGELAVADHRRTEEEEEVEEYEEPGGLRRARKVDEREQHGRARQQSRRQRERDESPPREDEHEAQEVERERDDPQQRHGGHVRRDVSRRAQHEARRHERQQRPAQPLPNSQITRRDFRSRTIVRAPFVVLRRLVAHGAARAPGRGGA